MQKIQLVKKENYKVSHKVEFSDYYQKEFGLPAVAYWVPLCTHYNSIKPDYKNLSEKYKWRFSYTSGDNWNYNSQVKFDWKYMSQYRDGCFYQYIWRLAI